MSCGCQPDTDCSHGRKGLLLTRDKYSRARSRGLSARVQIQTKFVLVVERGLEARGYVLNSMAYPQLTPWATLLPPYGPEKPARNGGASL